MKLHFIKFRSCLTSAKLLQDAAARDARFALVKAARFSPDIEPRRWSLEAR
ncbi:MAG: hypothetical protein LBC53_06400 [Spirochaetaceae bacterium]|nr:hypothetical protein [Spirochaetaceae bacterium]